MAGGVDAQQLQYVQQIEQIYSRRILDILEPVVGRQNVKAQVTAEVDFSQTESDLRSRTSPTRRPTPAPFAASSWWKAPTARPRHRPAGVPGATTQPAARPSPAAPINGPAQALARQRGGRCGWQRRCRHRKRESIINYEVDKTVRVVKGGYRRDQAPQCRRGGQPPEHRPTTRARPPRMPLTEQQMEKMTALVRETIGFNKDRGDSVNLMNAAFAQEKIDVPEVPLWKQPEMQELARSLAWPLGTLAAGRPGAARV